MKTILLDGTLIKFSNNNHAVAESNLDNNGVIETKGDALTINTDSFTATADKSLDISAFSLSEKTIGASKGKVGKYNGHTYMLKSTFKSKEIILSQAVSAEGIPHQYLTDFDDIVTETVKAGIYNHLLPALSPEISLVVDGIHQDRIYLASKFLNDFSNLHDFVRQSTTGVNVIGFAKTMSAILACGERDYHSGNLGAVHSNGRNYIATIDHGKSNLVFSGVNEMRGDMMCRFINHYPNIRLNVKEFLAGLREVAIIPESVISETCSNAVNLLLSHGVDFSDVSYAATNIHTMENHSKRLILGSFGGLRNKLQNNNAGEITNKFAGTFLHNQQLITRLIPQVEAVAEISPDGKWHDGGWIPRATAKNWVTAQYNSKGGSIEWEYVTPISFAIRNKCKIFIHDEVTAKVTEIIDPLEWAILNQQKIQIKSANSQDTKQSADNMQDPVIWGTECKYIVWHYEESGNLLFGMDPVAVAIFHNIPVNECDATVWAIEKELWLIQYNKAGQAVCYTYPLAYAINNQIEIEGQDPVLWAIKNPTNVAIFENNILTVEHPVYYAIRNNISIEDQDAVDWAIDNNCTFLNYTKGSEIAWIDPVICAALHKLQIENQDPITWAMRWNHNPTINEDGETIDPLIWAINNKYIIVEYEGNIATSYLDPVDYAIRNNKLIGNKKAISWAINNNYEIAQYSNTGEILGYLPPNAYVIQGDESQPHKENIIPRAAAEDNSTHVSSGAKISDNTPEEEVVDLMIDNLFAEDSMDSLGFIPGVECEV